MSTDETKPETTEATSETKPTMPPETTETKPSSEVRLSGISDVLSTIADKISSSGSQVKERVISAMVERKLSDRAAVLEKSLLKHRDMERDLKKIVPDVEQYVDGQDKPQKFFSKAKRDEKKKAEENKTKLEKMLETVLTGKTEKGEVVTDEHWNKLSEAVK